MLGNLYGGLPCVLWTRLRTSESGVHVSLSNTSLWKGWVWLGENVKQEGKKLDHHKRHGGEAHKLDLTSSTTTPRRRPCSDVSRASKTATSTGCKPSKLCMREAGLMLT
ncbi:uncharacterized protein LOC119343092 [Triticum dicoccoides]|uniref:uncharacterized protein LOC119343092 n=1 Tax=Triticum dicoccoides TaxID=85692 RepID=UPI00188F4EA3|nr:uncharacterized protein LOC119343092 [Triticum dicoccoides]